MVDRIPEAETKSGTLDKEVIEEACHNVDRCIRSGEMDGSSRSHWFYRILVRSRNVTNTKASVLG